MQSRPLFQYKAILIAMSAACAVWILLIYSSLTATVYTGTRQSLSYLPFPDLFRLDGNLTVPVGACSWSQAAGLIPCVYRTGKEIQTRNGRRLHLAVVACADRSGEAMVLLKSAVALTTRSFLVFHIFTDVKQHTFFVEQLKAWPAAYLERVEFRIYPATYPDMESWKHQFAPCASQRLLFPLLLRDVDAVVYVDADAVLLSPLDKLWAELSRFNSTQMVALAAEHEDAATSWYHHHSKIPFFRPYGLNSGVMLMNLTRLRAANWTRVLALYHQVYGKDITWFDQDLINIYCHFHPEHLYMLACSMNYRVDHCERRDEVAGSVCRAADLSGASLLHGNKRSFHNDPAFRAVYTAIQTYKLGDGLLSGLLLPLQKELVTLQGTTESACGRYPHIFLQRLMTR